MYGSIGLASPTGWKVQRPPQRKAVQKAPEGAPYLQPLLRCDGAGRILLRSSTKTECSTLAQARKLCHVRTRPSAITIAASPQAAAPNAPTDLATEANDRRAGSIHTCPRTLHPVMDQWPRLRGRLDAVPPTPATYQPSTVLTSARAADASVPLSAH